MHTKAYHILTISIIWLAKSVIAQSLSAESSPPVPMGSSGANNSEEKPTLLTFYIDEKTAEQLQEESFMELSLTIKEKDPSLKKAITKAKKKVELVRNVSRDYCQRNKGEKCEETVQTNNYKVMPSYQTVRREPIFSGFVVGYDAKIVVQETQEIGELVDNLLQLGIYQMESIQWRPSTEVDAVERAIDAGIAQAATRCKQIDRRMGMILSIAEMRSEKEKDEESSEGDEEEEEKVESEEEQEEDKESFLLKFEVECVGRVEKRGEKGAKNKKKKK